MIRVLIVLFCFSLSLNSAAQQATATAIDPAFEQEIDRVIDHSVPAVTVRDAYKDRSQYLFLDAREIEEYRVSHIPDAIYIGYDHFTEKRLRTTPKDTPLIVYCSIGYRSEKIGERLQKLGYTNVKNLYGSIFEWVNQGLPVEDPAGEATTDIHTYDEKWGQWMTNTKYTKVY